MSKVVTRRSSVVARRSGEFDGRQVVRDDRTTTPEVVEEWFRPGVMNPDEALINACTSAELARVLGLSLADVEARGDEWDMAIAAYNEGYRVGARREVRGNLSSWEAEAEPRP